MFERAERGNRAVILHPVFSETGVDALDEFQELALSAGVEIVAVLTAPRDRPDARYFVGRGKIDQLADEVARTSADLVLVSRPLSGIQERNIEARCQCRVLDRTTLILDIFAQRARSYEGKLQVELAQLRHLSTRLVRGWTHLERQKGGIGLRGPGETQLETDRRLLGQRIRHLRSRLDKVGRQREQSRRQRKRSDARTVALVGYTNAGKSTLFNRLTESDVDTRDMQFATLDPTVRQMSSIQGMTVLLADTVGFVSELPPELIAAFRATLLETREADLLLHVVDASDPYCSERQEEVNEVLQSIGAQEIPVIRVFNKIDRCGVEAGATRDASGRLTRVSVSALQGDGIESLVEAISDRLQGELISCVIRLEGQNARLRARLFEMGAVQGEQIADDGAWLLDIELTQPQVQQLASRDRMARVVFGEQLRSIKESDPAALSAR
ncbi:MAG: GTPase HflX [Xanthomonadales bacterium]|nr:GTPase HflX [Gammaproteobacteria bacterium]NNE05115.1 GTPase HflX [Xanthomonadales bacterium]NNL95772.1 GTPase HflX [Xanthomonadales bacterium]